METIKSIHVFCAYATGLGFLIRGILAVLQSQSNGHRLTKTLPHVIDTGLLASGLTMVYLWSISLIDQPWLLAKVAALLLYIAFGLLMLRWGSTERRRWLGLMGGMLTYAYIVGAAHGKSVLSWLAFV
jgi:uncharacterized membrane protein SirB2